MSLKKFFIISLFSLFGFGMLTSILFIRYFSIIQVNELYDAQMAQNTRMLQGFLNRPLDELDYDKLNNMLLNALSNFSNIDFDESERMTTGHGYENKLAVQLWDKEGNLLVKTPTAPLYLLTPLENGYSETHYKNHIWHTFTQHMPQNNLWIVLAERDDIRDELIEQSLMSLVIGAILSTSLMGLSLLWIIKLGLKPLNQISRQLKERNLNKLAAIQLDKTIPQELIPVTNAINQLMSRVENELEYERRFLGDVAHELRTPLSALKLQTQIALKTDSPDKIKIHLEKILAGIDRSNRLIQQLLTISKLDPNALGEKQNINLFDSLLYSIQDLDINIHSTNIDCNQINIINHKIIFNDSFRATNIFAYPILISVLFRNLIENACRYTPIESPIQLILSRFESHVLLQVIDNGPGVSKEKLESLGTRFFRKNHQNKLADQNGSGLGLSIVARIVGLHNGKLDFLNVAPHGLEVQIILPIY